MKIILEIINREDRKTVFYDSGPMIRRYQRQAAGRLRRKRAAASKAKADATAAAAAANKAAAAAQERRTRPTRNVSIQSRIGRYKGGSTVRAYDGSYHLSSAKSSRRSSRESRRQGLGKRITGRYSQLM